MKEFNYEAKIDSVQNSEEIRAILNMLKTVRGVIDINYETIGILNERIHVINNRINNQEKSNE